MTAATLADSQSLNEKYLKPLLGASYERALQVAGGRLTVEAVLQHLELKRQHGEVTPGFLLEDLARKTVYEIAADRGLDDAERFGFLNGWLRFVTANTPQARMRWAALAETDEPDLCDRDAYALALWQRIVGDRGGEGGLISYAERHWAPWDYYERHFFGWFLSRFDLFRARKMFGGGRLGPWFNAFLAPGALAVAALALRSRLCLGKSFLWLLFAILVLCIVKPALRLKSYVYLNSLIPRLAATVGSGYLFLINAPQVARFVVDLPRCGWLWSAACSLLLTALVYIMLHVWRRVHPALDFKPLFWRSLDLLALAVSYAALGLVAAAPVLFSKAVMGNDNVIPLPQHLAVVAAIALNLGVVLQLAWDEKPLTEPL